MSDELTMTLADEAPARMSASVGFGMNLANWEQAFKIAKVLATSQLVPKHYQGKYEDIVVAMQFGAEIGLPPMAALQSVAVINGRPGIFGDGFLAVIQASAAYVKHVEYYLLPDKNEGREVVATLTQADLAHDETRAVCQFWRRGIKEPFVGMFSIGDAKRAKLWGKQGPWTEYPARQLRWRARGFAGRDAFAAELRGIKLAEELVDTPTVDDPELLETDGPRHIPPPVRRSQKLPAKPVDVASDAPAHRKSPSARPPASSVRPSPAPLLEAGQQTIDSLVITDTSYVASMTGTEPYYEINARLQKEGAEPTTFIFRTVDEALYELAQSAEGTDQLFRITFHTDPRPEGTRKILDALAAS